MSGIPPEVVVHRPGHGDGVEGRVGDGPAHPAADHVVAPAVDLAPLDDPRSERRVEVTGEGVLGLVVVVVGVEHRVSERRGVTHGPSPRAVPVGRGEL